jgi:hypothetical protein
MQHYLKDKDFSTLEQFICLAYYGNTIKLERCYHILRFISFTDEKKISKMGNKNYYRLWKMRTIFDKQMMTVLNITAQLNI